MTLSLLNPIDSSAAAAEEARIAVIVQSVATLADQGNFETLERLFAPEVTVDYTAAFGGEVETKSRQALMNQWAGVLPGFDATQHRLSNIAVVVKDGTATATADVVADHYLEGNIWRISGNYDYRLAFDAGQWEITQMTFHADSETGSRNLMDRAVERVTENPTSYVTRQQTIQTVRDFLTSLEEKDMEKFAAVWAEDAVQDMPYSPEGFPKRVSGKENLIEHYSAWPEISGEANFTDNLIIYPMQDPQMVFVEYKGKVDVIPTGREYHQTYGGLFHVENGEITLFREYFNPTPFVYAFGLDKEEASMDNQ